MKEGGGGMMKNTGKAARKKGSVDFDLWIYGL